MEQASDKLNQRSILNYLATNPENKLHPVIIPKSMDFSGNSKPDFHHYNNVPQQDQSQCSYNVLVM